MPLLFQGHIELLEEYLSRSRDQQAAFVHFLDRLIDAEANIDAIVRCPHQSILYFLLLSYYLKFDCCLRISCV